MWPRLVEMLLGAWILASPLVLAGPADVNNHVAGALVILLAAASLTRRLRHAHFGQIAVAAWLILHAHLQDPSPPPLLQQSNIATSLCLVLVAILPPRVTRPPAGWQAVMRDER